MRCLVGCDPRASHNEVAPEENETRTAKKTRKFVYSPCFFSADSRSPPECASHSKAIKKLMRFRLRLFFSSFLTPCFRSLMIFVYYGHSGGGVVGGGAIL